MKSYKHFGVVILLALSVASDHLYAQDHEGAAKKTIWDAVTGNDEVRVAASQAAQHIDLNFTMFDEDLGQTTPLIRAIYLHLDNISLVLTLIKMGANPNLADPRGITPLLMAERLDGMKARDALIAAGAKPMDVSLNRKKSLETLIDAAVMSAFVEQYLVEGGESSKKLVYSDLERFTSLASCPVLRNKGLDAFGNPYILRPDLRKEHYIEINPATIQAAKVEDVKDFWFPYVAVDGQ